MKAASVDLVGSSEMMKRGDTALHAVSTGSSPSAGENAPTCLNPSRR
jgi:hypothetical protein